MIQATTNVARRPRYVVDLLTLNDAEIWTGADLCRLRDTIHRRIRSGQTSICLDLSHVKRLPAGFFGMPCCLQDQGIDVTLFETQSCIRDLIWFRRFFCSDAGNRHCFREYPRFTLDDHE